MASSSSSRKARRSPTKTHRERRRAVQRAQALGPLNPVPPALGTNEHGEPQLGQHQVFVTRSGASFHVGWCAQVIAISDQDPGRLVVIERSEVGGRDLCRTCRDEGPLR